MDTSTPTDPPAGRTRVALALAATLALVGCGGDTTSARTDATSGAPTSTTATTTASATPTTAPSGSTDPTAPATVPTAVTTSWVFDAALLPSDGAWSAPYGVDVADDGTVWVADTGAHRVVGLHPDGTETIVGGLGTGDGQFTTLGFGSLAVGPDGTVHVVDNGNVRIQSFAPDGTFLRAFGSQGSEDGQFQRAIGIAVDGDGQVHVTDDARPVVQVFSPDGQFVRSYGEAGDGPGQFLHATGIDVAPDGAAWVADFEAQRIQQFDPTGSFLAEFASPGAAGTSATLEGVEVTPEGGVLVTSYRSGQVLAVPGPDAEVDDAWPVVAGELGTGDGQFQAPVDLALAPDGSLVVTDQRTNTVQRFAPTD